MGPLQGVRVVEFAAIGPAPFCAMLLSDMGAEVLRIDRSPRDDYPDPVVNRGRAAILLDLKTAEGKAAALAAIEKADILVEGYRPGVMERLGLGPDEALARNPRLIYGRITGWGQEGPLADRAGHDINYIALSGALDCFGAAGGPPIPPLNLLGDFGGGAMYLALGLAAALYERERSGRGQVVESAIVDGVASLMSMYGVLRAAGQPLGRGENSMGGAGPFYGCYRCKDGLYMAVGSIEPQFRQALADALGVELTPDDFSMALSPDLKARLAAAFLTATREEWTRRLIGTDACCTPVLSPDEAAQHPHNLARGVYQRIDGVDHPAPSPRFGRTPSRIQGPAPRRGEGGSDLLRAWGADVP